MSLTRCSQSEHRLLNLLDADTLARADKLGTRGSLSKATWPANKSPTAVSPLSFRSIANMHPETMATPTGKPWKNRCRYIKQYEQETNSCTHLLIDGSESMKYGSGNSKLDYYEMAIAALLSLLSSNEMLFLFRSLIIQSVMSFLAATRKTICLISLNNSQHLMPGRVPSPGQLHNVAKITTGW